MVGEFGDVQLLDWGLVKVVGEGVESPTEADAHTRIGAITGTPAYMAPEQARGALDQIGPATDVYGLGALLYCILTGQAPYQGDLATVLMALVDGSVTTPIARTSKPLPPELVVLCHEAMSTEAHERPTAQVFTEHLDRWLDGSQKQQEATRLVDEANPLLRSARVLEQRALALQRRAQGQLEALPGWASESRKAKAWALAEQATLQARDARQVELLARRKLLQAIVHDSSCVDAHDHLAERFRHDHAQAEADGDEVLAERALDQLRFHVEALPRSLAQDHLAYLAGDGVLVVRSDPPGAKAALYRYEPKRRRYVAVKDRDLGTTPVELPLPMGRYLVHLESRGRHPVRWPVFMPRNGRVDNVPPQQHDPAPVRMLPKGEVGSEDVYVPAGWMLAGDRRCDTAASPRRVWVDGFVISRFPVTVAEYIVFLDALVELGRGDEAETYQPRRGIGGRPWLLRDGDRFRVDPDGLLNRLDLPVVGVDQASARAFLSWLSSRTGQTWRLPSELEWEKAARGVDGRLFPWGEMLDPTWARVRASSRTRPLPDVVDSYPVDESPFGVRGMGGNVAEWCLDPWKASGPDVHDERAVMPPAEDLSGPGCVRGGHWLALASGAQVPGRRRAERDQVSRIVGFRRVRSV
jgi:serine/threonine-protein kinase